MIESARSKQRVPIRLTDERWAHIVAEHTELSGLRPDVLEAVAQPEAVVEGRAGELLAVRELERGKWLIVVYREVSKDDGFVITAFWTRRIGSLRSRRQVWP